MAWYNSSWTYRFKVTIQSSQVEADLNDLDVLITEDNVPSAFWGHVNSDGSDIVVTLADGSTKVYRDLIHIDTGGETLRMRVRCNVLAATDVDLYVYYGNGAATEVENQTDAYHSSILNYWTLDESPGGAGSLKDRTANNDATPTGVTQNSSGAVGPCIESSGAVGNGVDCGDIATDALTELTWQCWGRLDTAAGASYRVLLRKPDASGHTSPYRDFDLSCNSDNSMLYSNVGDGSASDGVPNGVVITPGQWNLWTGVFDGGNTLIQLFKDDALGDEETSSAVTQLGSSSEPLRLLRGNHASDQFWDGRIDEVRILNRVMTLNEIKTRFNNEDDPGAFYSCGAEETDIHVTLEGHAIAVAGAAGELIMDTIAGGEVRMVAPGGIHELRVIRWDWIRKDHEHSLIVELYSPDGHPNPVLWSECAWFEASIDGGARSAVGTTRATAFPLGFFTAEQRKELELFLTIPDAIEVKEAIPRFSIGLGTT